MAGYIFSIDFDSGIEKVLYGNDSANLTKEITTSGDNGSTSTVPVYMKPIFKNGYEINTYSESAGSAITRDGDIYITNPTNGGSITFTSKLSAPRKSVDLTTLPGWANLSAGEHNITIVAKANGFKDSAPSASVKVTKAAAMKTLKAGTYKWVDNPQFNASVNYIEQPLNFTVSASTAAKITYDIENHVIQYFDSADEFVGGYNGNNEKWIDNMENEDNSYRTITLATDQQVSAEFYDWAITGGNLVEQPAMPVKGDIITMDSRQYRVLKTEGTVAEVLCMYDANSSIEFDTNSNYNNTYAGKNIDTYCNNTFYSGLPAAMKSAIVDKTFTQDSWERSNSVPTQSHYTGKYGSSTYYLTLSNASYGTSITRHCYCLSIQDVLDYLEATTSMGTSDTTLTDTNIWQMFWDVTTGQGDKYIWLRSANSSNPDFAFYVDGFYGSFYYIDVNDTNAARPAFQIDLSKISWSK